MVTQTVTHVPEHTTDLSANFLPIELRKSKETYELLVRHENLDGRLEEVEHAWCANEVLLLHAGFFRCRGHRGVTQDNVAAQFLQVVYHVEVVKVRLLKSQAASLCQNL
jgi:hypothetical protein